MNKNSVILAIESSCDDTSAAICVNGEILSNITANQQVHAQYGGVIRSQPAQNPRTGRQTNPERPG